MPKEPNPLTEAVWQSAWANYRDLIDKGYHDHQIKRIAKIIESLADS